MAFPPPTYVLQQQAGQSQPGLSYQHSSSASDAHLLLPQTPISSPWTMQPQPPPTYILQQQAGQSQPGPSYQHSSSASNAYLLLPQTPISGPWTMQPQDLPAGWPLRKEPHPDVQTLQRQLDDALRRIREHEDTSALSNLLIN